MVHPYRSLDDVVSGLASLEQRFLERRDRRAVFATLYGVVSAEVRERVSRRYFEDNDWVHRYAVAFANLYRDALVAWDSQSALPKAWRFAFETGARGSNLVLQDMLLGVNAHVNHDLPFAIDGIGIGADRMSRYRDHSAVNAVLASVMERATERIAALYAPGLTSVDACAADLDEMFSMFSLSIARDSAWESALALGTAANQVERALAGKLVAARSTAMARLLLAPSANPVFMAACRRIEAGSAWLTCLQHALATERT